MKLFLVYDKDRWGYSLNIVRADDHYAALKMVTNVSIGELANGQVGIVWVQDESPDSNW